MAANNHQTHIYVGLAGEGQYMAERGLYRYAESAGEGGPLNCAPSAVADAGNGRPLSYSLRSPSAHAVAGEWQSITTGLPPTPQVRALLIHPDNPAVLYAGTQCGAYRSDDCGEHW